MEVFIWKESSLILCYVLYYINTTSYYYFLITSESNMSCLLFPGEKSNLWALSVFSHVSLTNDQNYNISCVRNCTQSHFLETLSLWIKMTNDTQ